MLEEGRLVQFGSPEDIYFHPATPFVARFTGLAGELRVKIVGQADDGLVEVTAPGCSFPRLRAAGGPGSPAVSFEAGADAVLAIRPTGVSVARGGSEERHLTGRVADVAFRGRGYELAIDLPGHGRLTGVFARHRTVRGEEVALRLEPDGCHLFPAAPGAGTASGAGPNGCVCSRSRLRLAERHGGTGGITSAG